MSAKTLLKNRKKFCSCCDLEIKIIPKHNEYHSFMFNVNRKCHLYELAHLVQKILLSHVLNLGVTILLNHRKTKFKICDTRISGK